MTTSTIEHDVEPRRPGAGPDFPTILGVAAALGAIAALCEDATIRLVLWAFLN